MFQTCSTYFISILPVSCVFRWSICSSLLEEDQIILTGWEDDIADIAKSIVEKQSPKQYAIKSITFYTEKIANFGLISMKMAQFHI